MHHTFLVNKYNVKKSKVYQKKQNTAPFYLCRSMSLENLNLGSRDDGGILNETQGESQAGVADLVYPQLSRRGLTNPHTSPSPNLELDGNSTPED